MVLQHAALRDTVCLEVRGADAAPFLQAQLTRSVADLDPASAPLAAWADPRGRLRALVRVCPLPDRWLLITPRDGADELLKRLRVFVLRAKVTLARADDVHVAALLGSADDWLVARGVAAADVAPNRLVRRGDVTLIRVGPAYWQVLGTSSAAHAFATELGAAAEATEAELAEIALGIPAITLTLADRFVAQMLNLDALDAVSFDKGCYPGQEVIARVHNLGGVKRRARRYAAPAEPPTVGTPVLAAAREVGEVVRSAPARTGCELLAIVEHAAVGSPLTCAGAPLAELPLPFEVPRD
ncbi:MAG TPA: folate-binding protein [Gammaproteobacteria bacterium]|nr:folate-binding protein [Gammaproteobacteria bacterium]